MSQHVITNGSMNTIDSSNAKDVNQLDGSSQAQQSQANQPNVRHIPIFVEGRDEPLFNKNLDTTDAPISLSQNVLNDIPQPGSIFSRVKDIPVKKFVPEFQENNFGRSASPARTIPINMMNTESNSPDSGHQLGPTQASSQQRCKQARPSQLSQHADRRSSSPKPQPADPITKIQNLQKEISELMDKVDKYKGGSRKDKEYIYLDEMLTQNLLKLDTIDTEGKENIKAARKEAINCINKCIQVLEAKIESRDKSQNVNTCNEISVNSKEQIERHPSKDNFSIKESKQNDGNRGNQRSNERRENQSLQAQ